TILKRRESPHSNLLPVLYDRAARGVKNLQALRQFDGIEKAEKKESRPAVRILETGVVGSLDYKVLEADRADALFQWLKDNKYQDTWGPRLQAAAGCTPGGIRGGGEQWVKDLGPQVPVLLKRAQDLGFRFMPGQRPLPNAKGHIPTTMEWSRKLSADDVKVL